MRVSRATRFAGFLLLLVAPPAVAGLPVTKLGGVFPPGGQAGTTFEVQVLGEENLDYETAPRLTFSHPGIVGEAVVDPATGAWQTGRFRVTVPVDVPPGRYEAMLDGAYGASNPRAFRVEGRRTSVETAEANAATPIALDEPRYGRVDAKADVDVLAFSGPAGQTVVLRCDAAGLDSPLQPVIELKSAAGRLLGTAGGPYGGEATLAATLPADGEYAAHVTDAAYRGGADFGYRLEVTARPVVAFVWPPAGVPSQTGTFDLYGYNLPEGEPVEGRAPLVRKTVEIALPGDGETLPVSTALSPSQVVANGFDYVLGTGAPAADPAPVYFSREPLRREAEPNDGAEGERVAVPSEIAGRFDRRGDSDRFVFGAKKGEPLYVEVFAQRYGSRADPVLTVERLAGPDQPPQQVAVQDDQAEAAVAGVFDVATGDPIVRFDPPEDGTYRVTVRDRYAASRGAVELAYRLSLRRPEPDFRLALVPFDREKADGPALAKAVALRNGESLAVTVAVVRRDGFDGPIVVRAEGLPPGLTASPLTLGPAVSSAPFMLTASDDAAVWRGPVTVVGEAAAPTAENPTRALRHSAAFQTLLGDGKTRPTTGRLAGPFTVSILEEASPFRIATEGGEVRVAAGSQVLVPLRLARAASGGPAEALPVTAKGIAPDAKVTAEVKPFEPAVTEQIARLLIDPKAPPRSQVVAFEAAGKIDYAAYPHRLRRAKSGQEAAVARLTGADATLLAAKTARDEAVTAAVAAEAVKVAAEQAATVPEAPAEAGQQAAAAAAALEEAKRLAAEREAAAKSAEEARQQAEAAKKAADQAVAEAEKLSASQKIDSSSTAAPLTLTVVPSLAELAPEAPNAGAIKRGESVEIKVAAKRAEGFAGAIGLALALPPGVAGLSAEPAVIEPGKTEAILRVTAAGDAAEGDVAFPAIRATFDAPESAPLDQPLTLKVVP